MIISQYRKGKSWLELGIEKPAKQDVEVDHGGYVLSTLCISRSVWEAQDVELGAHGRQLGGPGQVRCFCFPSWHLQCGCYTRVGTIVEPAVGEGADGWLFPSR